MSRFRRALSSFAANEPRLPGCPSSVQIARAERVVPAGPLMEGSRRVWDGVHRQGGKYLRYAATDPHPDDCPPSLLLHPKRDGRTEGLYMTARNP